MVCSRILILYIYAVWMGPGGLGMGYQWLTGLVSRVCLYAIWMGGVGDGLPMVSRISLWGLLAAATTAVV